ncbi:MAG: hypothetical protein KDK30_17000 [Leptospiraceae bacterium]|nr:hypothetical protein [Leptospiraceae bacterium]MCB1316092.1 hypothetical protein [Leptospiraceae bacterium]MCB1320384.1 hypothetical protein [Leptospiraceae bacterium]
MNSQATSKEMEQNRELHIQPDALARVVDEVRADAQAGAVDYLKDSIVPEGGE